MLIDVQQMDNLGAASSRLPKLPQLQSHLTAASNAVDYKGSAMCPNPFLHEAARQSSQAEHSLQRHQPPVSNQSQGEATSVSMLSGDKAGAVSLGSSSQPLHQLRPQHADFEAPLQRLGIRQLQELLGMKTLGKSLHQQHDGQCATKIATSSTTSSTSSLLPQKRPHASVSALLQPSVLEAAFAGLSSAPASGQLLVRHSLTDSQTALWTQPEALEALRSQRASLTGMLRTQSTSQSCGQSLQQQQTAFLRPFQTALQDPRETAARQTSGHTPRSHLFTHSSELLSGGRLSLSLPCGPGWQGSSLASTQVGSNSKPSSSTLSKGLLMGACQNQAASPSVPQNHWRNLANQAVAPPSSDARGDTVRGSSRLLLQDQGLQSQPASAISSITSSLCAKPQWFESPEAMHRAALMLNAQLANIDKQVLEHVVPHCGQQGKRGPGLSDTSVIQAQVLLMCWHCPLPFLLRWCR